MNTFKIVKKPYFVANACFFLASVHLFNFLSNVIFSVEPTVKWFVEWHFPDVIVSFLND